MPQLTHVHFQLTRRCNLNCVFCGQQGRGGELDGKAGRALTTADFLRLLAELERFAPGIHLTLWGGEPLLFDGFAEVAGDAYARGFNLSLVTNGTLIDRHLDLLRNRFREIFVSVDGPEAVHNRVRGAAIYQKVKTNLDRLHGGSARVTVMSVLSPDTMPTIDQAPFGMAADGVILHELIYLDAADAAKLPPGAGSRWRNNALAAYPAMLAATLEKLKKVEFPLPAVFMPHFADGTPCREPERHLCILFNGESGSCTDFTDVTFGNVRDLGIAGVWQSEAAAAFRAKVAAGENVYCSHCAWKNTPETVLNFTFIPRI